MSWKKIKLKQILKQYRIEHLVQNNIEYKQVTISKYDGVTFRGSKMGREIGRKRQFQIDLKKFPSTLLFVRQGVQDGSIGIAPLEVDGCIATENMPMFSVEGINLEYLKFLLKSPYFYDELNKIQTTGSAQKSIHEREILEIEIPFPDIEEQEDIVQQLSSIKNNSLEIYSELTHQLTIVKKLRQQLLQDAVQGKLVGQNKKDEPASELLKKIKAEKEKLIAEKKIKKEKELPPIKAEDILFEIPEGWVWCRLGEIVQYTENKDIHKHLSSNTIINYIDIDAIDNQNQVIREVKQKPVIELSTRARRVLKKGYIMYSTVRPYLKNIAIIEIELENFIGSTGFNVFKTILVDTKYVFDFLLTPKLNDEFKEMMVGFNSPSITNEQFEQTLFPLPPLAEQNRIVQKLDELMQYCSELEASIKQSELQNEKLLQQVLREALRKEPVGA